MVPKFTLLVYSRKALCLHWHKEDGKVISIVLVHEVKHNLQAEGTGFDTCSLPFSVL